MKIKYQTIFTVLIFSLPVMLSQACDSLMMFTGRYFLSQINPIYAAAATTGGMTAFLLWIFGVGLLGFTNPLVAQFFGANEIRKSNLVAVQSFSLSFILAIPLLIFGSFIGDKYFTLLKLPKEEHFLAYQYLSIVIYSCFFIFVKNVFSSYFSGIGKTRIVLITNIAGVILNIPLSYFLIKGNFGVYFYGIKGAAFATFFSEIGVSILYLILFINQVKKNISYSFDFLIFKKLIQYGAPIGTEFFALTLAFNTFVTMFHSFGINESLAITITMNWSFLTVPLFFGLNIAVMSLVGRSIGEKNLKLAEEYTISALFLAFAVVLFSSIFFIFLSNFLISFFDPLSLKNSLLKNMIHSLPLYFCFDAICFVLTGALRAAGDTKFCFKVGSICHWSCLILSYIAVYQWKVSAYLVWSFFIINLCVQSFFYIFRYAKGTWKELKII